jgi:predicted NAD/FAD-dependent oxidoreductase
MDISWIALNSHKPQRPISFSLMIQSTNEWAEQNVEQDKSQVLTHLRQQTEQVLGQSLQNADYSSVHRWLYANTVKRREHHGDVYLDKTNQLAAAGDWCGNARVESAFLHAKKLVKELMAVL